MIQSFSGVIPQHGLRSNINSSNKAGICSPMASSFLVPIAASNCSPFLSKSPPLPFLIKPKPKPNFRLRLILCSTRNGMDISDKRKLLLEEYGLNPADYLSEESNSSKMKRRRGREKPGKGTLASPGELKTPRTTHKLLQVLGGKARRRKLLSPTGMDVRPMMEVVRGAAFDLLQVAGGCPASLRPGRWLDLYSGTGSVGIEAISRGCSQAHFVEMDPWVISEVLRPNLEWTGFFDLSVIHPICVETFLEQAKQFPDKYGSFDYISVTPPYTAVDYTILMDQFSRSPLVGDDTFILVEYPLRTVVLSICGSLTKIADRRFGRTNLAVYGPAWSQKKCRSKTSIWTASQKAELQMESSVLGQFQNPLNIISPDLSS